MQQEGDFPMMILHQNTSVVAFFIISPAHHSHSSHPAVLESFAGKDLFQPQTQTPPALPAQKGLGGWI